MTGKRRHSLAGLLAVAAGAILSLYCRDIWRGMQMYDPPLAPITPLATGGTFGLALIGVLTGVVAMSRGHRFFRLLGTLGALVCISAAALWTYWLSSDMLMPYAEFADLIGP